VAGALRFETCRPRLAIVLVEVSSAGCTSAQARGVKLDERMQNKKPQNISRPSVTSVTVP